ncbi:MAG: starch phosphorylase [Parasphingorhabdus sp.]|jgi:starch phosphorylase
MNDWNHNVIEFKPESVDLDPERLKRSVANRLMYAVGKDPITATELDWFFAIAFAVRDRMVNRWMQSSRQHYIKDHKRVYYLSAEFLIGRSLDNALSALDIFAEMRTGLEEMGLSPSLIEDREDDPALGNGGLGRLAACFLDSMAALNIAGMGYGIRYEYGMFKQGLKDGWQVEYPDHWLEDGNPWEFPRPEVVYSVNFGGQIEHQNGKSRWVPSDEVNAMAYDMLIPGWGTDSVNTLRLWSAKSTHDIDLVQFNQGKYTEAVARKNQSETVSRVLYPDDSTAEGRELRLRQEYFFVSASIQDLVRRFCEHNDDWDLLPEKVAVHLNDTHPSLAIPELMRMLIDIHELEWDHAWRLLQQVFSYTNHTLMPEALETWPTEVLSRVLPRHLELILQMNEKFLNGVAEQHPGDTDLLRRVSLVEEGYEQRIRMGQLSVLASHKVNGVSAVHSQLVKDRLFPDFNRLFPGRFINITNGITHRRWLDLANPKLSAMLDECIGKQWRRDLYVTRSFEKIESDPEKLHQFSAIKLSNKQRLAKVIFESTGIRVNSHAMFDVQIKRMHEYKRQLLNVLQVVARYQRILKNPNEAIVPRVVVFSGKAASAYWMAKLIIKLINDVARVVNSDERVGNRLKVVFLPNYNVSLAQHIIAAADLSEQISTAGTEASGTGNMKLALNGALTIGTDDGANIEIREEVGDENIFIFGHSVDEVENLRTRGYLPRTCIDADAELAEVITSIRQGDFCPEQLDRYSDLINNLENSDYYQVLADFRSYMDCQSRVDRLYEDQDAWIRKALKNVSRMGKFSSDRAISDYAEKVWKVSDQVVRQDASVSSN